MDDDLVTDVSLLSKIQSSTDLTGVHRLFSTYLHPFTPMLKPSAAAKKPSRASKTKTLVDVPSTRSLAKQFLSFISKSLSILPKRICESPKVSLDCALEMFHIYRLCLECLDVIAPELCGKPYSIQGQRIRYMHCLEHWELYIEAEAEGIFVLQNLNTIVSGGLKGNSRKSKTRLVPELKEETVDRDVAPMILEIVVTLIKCISKRTSKVGDDYWRVISLVNESESWFRILDPKDYEKFHKFLETHLHITTLFLVAEIKSFKLDLIREFSIITFKEYRKSSAHDQMYKAALKICSSLFSQREQLSSSIILDVLTFVLDFMSAECKVGEEKITLGFLELVCYCANHCHSTALSLCFPVAELLNRLAASFHEDFQLISSILKLYVTGLLASSSCDQLKGKCREKYENTQFGPDSLVLLDNKEQLQELAASINLLNCHIDIGAKEKNSLIKLSSLSLSYWEALKYLCESLAEYIYSNRKAFLAEAESTSTLDYLNIIYDALNQFCNIFLNCLSTTERERETSGENHRVISVAVVAALMLSFRTNQHIKESTLLVKQLISTEWVPVKRLKYLYVSLNNIAVILNRKKRLKEAAKALKYCCKASWNYVIKLCRMHTDKSQVSLDDLSERGITDFVMDAFERIAFLMELNREGNCKLTKIIKESLQCWLVAENLIATLPVPASLVKEWVKMQYLLSKDANKEEHSTVMSLLIPFPREMSMRAKEKLLEEELLAYDAKSHLNPNFSLKMRIEIIDILLQECYVMKDSGFDKCRILVEKGKVLRAHGLARLDECIKCLSDAIFELKSIYSKRKSCCSRVHHLLVHAYILHALLINERTPNSVVLSPRSIFLHDVDAALKLVLNPDHDHAGQQYNDMLYLWYQLIDLLSIKGYLELHPSLYDAVIKLFKEQNFHLTKTISELLRSKRLSHALCVSSVNHMFVDTFSKHQSHLFNSSEFWRMCKEELKPLPVGFHHTIDEIKQAASVFVSHVPQTSHSIFLSSNLYYELSERLISCGRIIEALKYAKEAHQLRSQLLRRKFEYSVEKMIESFDEGGKIIEKSYYGIQTFKVNDAEATKVSGTYEGCVLTPWNVLSCYLESLLQVGIVHEILGNVSEAEMLLRLGRNVSQFQALPLFEIAFSSMLGKLCYKQKLWTIAEKEFSHAKNILDVNHDSISCKRCSCKLAVSLNQQIGNLFMTSSCSTGEVPSTERLQNAKILYKSALEKLTLSEWGIFYSSSDGTRGEQAILKESSLSSCATDDIEENALQDDKSEVKIQPRRSRRTKKEVKNISQNKDLTLGQNRRITRSTHSSKTCPGIDLANEHMAIAPAEIDKKNSDCDSKCAAMDFQHTIASLCKSLKCWHCIYINSVKCNTLADFISSNWVLDYRRLCLRLLIGIGKLSGLCDNAHGAHDVLLQSISILFNRNSNCLKYTSDSLAFLIESIGKNFPGDLLAVERAALIYYICWFNLKCYPNQSLRYFCSELSSIGINKIVSWLKMSFILSREVPVLFQKVSKLLSVLYVLSSSSKQFSLSQSEEGFESFWASFFHQASLGTNLNQHIMNGMIQKNQEIATDSEEFLASTLASTSLEVPDLLRSSPDCIEDLEGFVQNFFQCLPSTPVICISLVTGSDACLLTQLLHCSPTIQAWILLSHLGSDDQQIALLPIWKNFEVDDASSSSAFDYNGFVKKWECPWVSSAIDDIAPVFRHVLEGNYYSSSNYFSEHTKDNTRLWWSHRRRLDECLGKFLQDMEDYWLGPWKYLLVGEWPHGEYLDSVQKNLFKDDGDFMQLVATKNCYIGMWHEEQSKSPVDYENKIESLFKRMVKVSEEDEEIECMDRKPIILVLDFEVQMLPWENLPILRNQEVYRMPSVGSIFATLERYCQNQEQFETIVPVFPLIDPLDSYYLLNPSGDLHKTQITFENWFKDQNMEGKAGTAPTIEELVQALKDHDLYVYFGHGTGMQYIPEHRIQKLDKCAASLLLGCCSGSLYLKGCYMPQGAPISYLLAGSPFIVANLWEVTDKDIDRFGKAMLEASMSERSTASVECLECNALSTRDQSRATNCNHRRRIGSFMREAREACTLRFLNGAAPVCYGIPTGIIKRKEV